MPKIINKVGMRFGDLEVISMGDRATSGSIQWLCRCDCGNEKLVRGNNLQSGNSKNCGCKKGRKLIDETGNVYGKLKVIKEVGKNKDGLFKWLCKCECGNEKTTVGKYLRDGKTKSCGVCSTRTSVDITGQIFGMLNVVGRCDEYSKNKYHWYCQCECGNFSEVSGTALRTGRSTSCGCKSRLNLVGNVYGRLKVLSRSNKNLWGSYRWLCQCECGETSEVVASSLLNGDTKSCGCRHRGCKTHGTIYKIVDDKNTILYIGQTTAFSLLKRLNEHLLHDGIISQWNSLTGKIPKIYPIYEKVPISQLNQLERDTMDNVAKKTPLLNLQCNYQNSGYEMLEELVSKSAHKIKSYAERMGISYEEAEIEKKYIIPFKKLSAVKQKELIYKNNPNFAGEELTTEKKRVKVYRQLIKEK